MTILESKGALTRKDGGKRSVKAVLLAYFNAIKEVLQLMIGGNRKCGLKEWCKKSPDVEIDERCDVSPWKHCTDNRLCPYAILWRNWNLSDFEPFK